MTYWDLQRDVCFINDNFDVVVSVTGPGFDLYDQDGNFVDSFGEADELIHYVETN
jgi:hypothetical protein